MIKIISNEEYKQKLDKVGIRAVPIEEYVTAKTKIKHLCLKHNIEFMAKPDSLFCGRFPCPICKKEKKEYQSSLLRTDPNSFEKQVRDTNPYVEILSTYKSQSEKIKYRCKDCGYEASIFAGNLLRERPCVNCGKSTNSISEKEYGERLLLKYPNISYTGNLMTLQSILHFECNVDNNEWDDSANNVLRCGCKVCSRKIKNNFSYTKELHDLHSYVFPTDDYTYSNKKILHRCNKCGYEFKESPSNLLSKLKKNIGICQKCSDGLSYPNKISRELIRQLSDQIYSIQYEFSPRWCIYKDFKGNDHKGRYDNFITLKNQDKVILEMDGGFHTMNNNMSGQTKELSQYIDEQKDKLAMLHGYKVIRIDCNYLNNDKFEYIKNNILTNNNLNSLFSLNAINWNKILINCEKSYFIESCNYWNSGLSINDISIKTTLSPDTVRGYLKRGAKNNFCTYDAKKEHKKSITKIKQTTSKPCICLDTNKVFASISDAGNFYDVDITSISLCCNGKRKSAGKMTWAFYNKIAI